MHIKKKKDFKKATWWIILLRSAAATLQHNRSELPTETLEDTSCWESRHVRTIEVSVCVGVRRNVSVMCAFLFLRRLHAAGIMKQHANIYFIHVNYCWYLSEVFTVFTCGFIQIWWLDIHTLSYEVTALFSLPLRWWHGPERRSGCLPGWFYSHRFTRGFQERVIGPQV